MKSNIRWEGHNELRWTYFWKKPLTIVIPYSFRYAFAPGINVFFYVQIWGLYRDSVMGIATRYGLGGLGFDGRWGPSSLLYSGYRGALPGVKRPGRGVDHRHPPSPEVKNEYSYNSTLPVWLHGILQEEICRYIQTWFPTQTKKSTN